MGYDRVQLKRSAKQAMKYQRPNPMLITLLFGILVSIGTQLVSRILGAVSGSGTLTSLYAQMLVQYEDPALAIQYVMLAFGPQRIVLALSMGVFFSGLVTSLWAGFMRVGYDNFCLDMVRGQQPQTGALFSHFPQWMGVLLTKFLEGLFRGLWGLLLGMAGLGFLFVSALPQMDILLIVGMIVSYLVCSLGYAWVTLRYAMVDFVIVDQGLTGMDAIRESKRLVRENSNTGRLFVLKLSFIGWRLAEAAVFLVAILIGMVAFGPEIETNIGSPAVLEPMIVSMLGLLGLLFLAVIITGIFNLWLTPYIAGAEALFYDWARGVYNTRPAGGFGGGQNGWGHPGDYTRITGPTSGTGTGSGPAPGGGSAPRSPKPPRDDPWN